MEILNSRNLSLLCAVLNGFFAIQSFLNGGIFFGLLCLVFCGYCTNNYLKTGGDNA